ncbi:MAG TPA: ABC transporter permease [Gemmatales bacterium]|nr:ABC transporter permease [Gemmatales bacterium]
MSITDLPVLEQAPVPAPEAAGPPAATPAPLVIQATSGWRAIDLAELWRFRELLYFLTYRDISIRYKQTALGAAWAILQPVLTMLIFSLFFGVLGGLNKRLGGDYPYALYVFCGLLPWQLFAFALTESSRSVANSRNLITKVYFPRLLIPLAPLLSGLVDFAIAGGVFALLMLWFGQAPGWPILLLPIFTLMALVTAFAFGIWLSALNALYRDVQYTITFLVQVWMFLTPIAYPTTIVPEHWRWVYSLNPMVGVVEGFRWALLGTPAPGVTLAVSTTATIVLLVGGLFFFRRMERTFADVV